MSWPGLDGITLLDPWFLAVIPLALLAAAWRWRTPRAALPTASLALFAGAPTTWRQRLVWLPAAAKVVAACCLAVALARPVERDVLPVRELGIDIALVVDVSSSMASPDMDDAQRATRMEAARQRAEQFAAARVHDRVGLVAFARYPELRCPLTSDERALAAFLRVLETVPEGSDLDATAIGNALAKGVQVLRASDARSRVVVLLTDGQETAEDVTIDDAIALAVDAGVRVHTIGLGNGQRSPFGYIALDFGDLRRIAEATGGEFFQPRSDDDLGRVYARIDELEKVELEDPRYRTVDRFDVPLAAGLAVLLAALLADVLLFRRTP